MTELKELKAEATLFIKKSYGDPAYTMLREHKVEGKLFLSDKTLADIEECTSTLKKWKETGVKIESITLFCDNSSGYIITDDGKTVLNDITISFYYGDEPASIFRRVDVSYKNNIERFIF